jgi:hypothetical protein
LTAGRRRPGGLLDLPKAPLSTASGARVKVRAERAEYLAIVGLQADALVTLGPGMAAKPADLAPVAPLQALMPRRFAGAIERPHLPLRG